MLCRCFFTGPGKDKQSNRALNTRQALQFSIISTVRAKAFEKQPLRRRFRSNDCFATVAKTFEKQPWSSTAVAHHAIRLTDAFAAGRSTSSTSHAVTEWD